MKICVFSTPRTCSTFICNTLSNRFKLNNVGERLYSNFSEHVKKEKDNFIKLQDNYVIKVFAKYFYDSYIELQNFDWGTFDYIFITQRNNLTEQIASLYNIRYPERTHIEFTEEVIELFNTHKECIQLFYDIKTKLIQSYENVFIIEYEFLQHDVINSLKYLNDITNMSFEKQHLSARNKNIINYKQKYTNYNELKLIIDDWNIEAGS